MAHPHSGVLYSGKKGCAPSLGANAECSPG